LVVLEIILVLTLAENTWSDKAPNPCTIMHPDRETRLKWIQAYEKSPRAYIDEELKFCIPLRGSLSLLSHLDYTPVERNQGACGNCWAWAGTGVLGIALDVEKDIFDRLSVQFISSCNAAMGCCEGGWLSNFASFYSSKGYSIPWSNGNASWQNGDGNCNVLCETISTSPDYPITSITAETISTHGVGQAQAIANIKNVLNQNRAVWFGFFMGTQEDWNSFSTFWNTKSEDTVWDFDASCGKPWIEDEGGGHAVLCVGYNDDDPDESNHYWIMLNTWGITEDRPNGLFRVDMDVDYNCADDDGEFNLYWQTLDIAFGGAPTSTTDSADSVTSSSAMLNGTVNPRIATTTYFFEYGASTAYGLTTGSKDAGSGAGDLAVSAAITELSPNTTYHCRLTATNSYGTSYGEDNTFTTLAVVEVVNQAVTDSSGSSGCFIATAAFGSPMQPYVKILREFRNQILLNNSIGKSLVNLYYKYSPPMADCISRHDNLRAMIRIFLLPVVGMSWMALRFGPVSTLGLLFLLFALMSAYGLIFLKKIHLRRHRN